MKLPFFQKPVSETTKVDEGSLQAWRTRILALILFSGWTLLIGTAATLASSITAYQQQRWGSLILAIGAYVWVVILNVFRAKFSVTAQTISLLAILYILGLINLIETGLAANGGVFLLTFIALSALMIGLRSGISALAISILTYAIVAQMVLSKRLEIKLASEANQHLLNWMSGGLVFTLVGTLIIVAVTLILRGLESSIANATALAAQADSDKEQIQRNNQDIKNRLAQLRTATEISRAISGLLEPEHLFHKVVELVGERLGLYYVGIFLLDEGEQSISLQAGTGELIPKGYKLTVSEGSSIGASIIHQKPRGADVGARSKDQLSFTHLPLARTELSIPLISHDKTLGALGVQSTKPNAFDDDDIMLLRGVADSLAIAIENARLFQQVHDNLDEIRKLQRQYQAQAWSETERIYGTLSYTYESDAIPANAPDYSLKEVPIVLRDQPIGQLTLETKQTAWSADEQSLIEAITTEAALALENARLLQETQRQAEHEKLVADITRSVRSSSDIETILSTAIRELGRNLHVAEGTIQLYSPSTPTELSEIDE